MSYNVEVAIELKSNVLQTLETIARELKQFQQLLNNATEDVDKLAGSLGKLVGDEGKISGLVGNMEKLAQVSGAGLRDGFEQASSAMGRVVSQSERLTSTLRENAKLSGQLAQETSRIRPTAGGAAGPGYHGGSAAPAPSPAPSPAAPGSGKGHGDKPHGIFGGFLAWNASQWAEHLVAHQGGEAILKGLHAGHEIRMAESDERVTPEIAKSLYGRAVEVATSSDKKTGAPGSTINENLQHLLDLHSIVGGDYKLAMEMLPEFEKQAQLIASLKPEKGGTGGDPVLAAAKAMELWGAMYTEVKGPDGQQTHEFNRDQLIERLRGLSQVISSEGARVTAEDYLTFLRQAGPAAHGFSLPFMLERLPAILQSERANRAGTAAISLEQIFAEGGALTPKNMGGLVDLGLADPGGLTRERDPHTHKMKQVVHPNAIHDLPLLFSDPDKWALKARERLANLRTKEHPHGITEDAEIERELLTHMQRSTVGRLMAVLIKDSLLLKTTAENVQHQVHDPAEHYQTDPEARLHQLKASGENLQTAVGVSLMQPVLDAMGKLTGALNKLTVLATEHPEATKDITIGGGGAIAGLAAWQGAKFMGAVDKGPFQVLKGLLSWGAEKTGVSAMVATLGGTLSAAIAGGVAAFIAGNHAFGPETEKAQQDLAKQRHSTAPINLYPQDGFNIDGTKPNVNLGAHLVPHADNATTPTTSAPVLEQLGGSLQGLSGATDKLTQVGQSWTTTQVNLGNGLTQLGGATQGLSATVDRLNNLPLPPPVQQTVQVSTQINLDGRAVGQAVTEHQVRQAERAPSSGSHYDVRLGPLHPNTPF